MAGSESAVPIDRGWAWIVVMAAFMNLVFLIGISKCFGMLFAELIEMYHGTASSTSSMLAISAGLSLFLAPLTTTLSDVFTCRKVSMIGAVLCCLGFFIPAFCNSLEQIILSFGILTGFGYGACLIPSTIIVSRYFDRFRSLANGLMFSGSGVGGMLIPLFLNFIIEQCGLQGAFIILAAMALQSVVFAALYRPPEYWTRTRSISCNEEQAQVKLLVNAHPDQDNDAHVLPAVEEEEPALSRRHRSSIGNCHQDHRDNLRPQHSSVSHLAETNSNIFLSVPQSNGTGQRSRAQSNATLYFSAMNLAAWPSIPEIQYAAISRRDNSAQTENEPNLERADSSCCVKCSTIFRRAWFVKATDGTELPLFDFSLLKRFSFLLFLMACTFVLASAYIGMIVPPHCSELGMTKTQVALLLAVQGGADTAGRLIAGFLGDRSFVKSRRKCLVTMCCLICSLATFASVFLTTFWSLAGYLVIVSLVTGAYIATIPVMLVDLVGIENLSRAWGLTAFLEGFSVTLTPLIIGVLRDWTLAYYSGLKFIGCSFTVATVCLFAMTVIEHRHSRRPLVNPPVK